MCNVIEKEGKTISEAVMNACEELGVSKSEVEIEVIREDSRGLLGIGGRKAIVRVEVKSEGLSEKGVLAKRALETILGFMFSSAHKAKISETEDKIALELPQTEDKRHLVGKGGEAIKALEYVVGRISSKNSQEGKTKRVSISVDGRRDRKRESDVSRKVAEAARKARESGKPQTLERLSSYERKMAYSELRKISDVKYESVPVGGNAKKIVVSPRD